MGGAAELAAGVAAVTVPLVLLSSLAGHLLRPYGLAGALRAHRILPRPLAGPVAVCAIAAEALTGVPAAAGAVTGRAGLLGPALAGAAALLAAFAAYGRLVIGRRPRTGPAVPCGCGGSTATPLTGWVAGRAALLAAVAAAGSGSAAHLTALHGWHAAVCLLAGAALAVLLWTLPLAMLTPERTSAV